ncbi:MAG: hypothetical protein AAGB06_00780 [Verrucomicrobiota bacterium]
MVLLQKIEWVALACFLLIGWHARVLAQPELDRESGRIPAPTGKPILQITGKIQVSTDGERAIFDYELLKQFPQHSLRVKSPWFDSERIQTGPLLGDLLEFLGIHGSSMYVQALNGYTASVPVADAKNLKILLSIDRDGRPLRVRDKGPVFITYPFTEMPELHNDITYAKSVWMVNSIEIQ